MPDEKYTRCPECSTVFRVTSEQLALRDGQVRCGQCKTVFDGRAQQVAVAAPRSVESGTAKSASARTAPSVKWREPAPLEALPEMPTEPAFTSVGDVGAETLIEDRFSRARQPKPRRTQFIIYAFAAALLLLLIAAQSAFHFHDAIAAHVPAARPVFVAFCKLAGCSIRPLRDPAMNYLSIDASDLQADPAHRGLLVLTATLRSRAAWALAYPYLELTLTDAQDRVVVRRALAPADYAGGTVDLQRGIAPNGEISLKTFIDASATSQAGYRLYMFYP